MMRFEYDPKFIKLLTKEMVKEMQKVKSEAKEPELITVKEAAETLNLSEDYVKDKRQTTPCQARKQQAGPSVICQRRTDGSLPQFKIGSSYFLRKEVELAFSPPLFSS